MFSNSSVYYEYKKFDVFAVYQKNTSGLYQSPLAFITFLSLLSFISFKSNKVLAEDSEVQTTTDSVGKTTQNDTTSDGNFSIEKGLNDIYTGDQSGKTMNVVITANNNTLVNPKGTKQDCTIDCTWVGCGRRVDNAPFYSAKLTFTLYRYNGTSTTSKILDYTLTCKGDKWLETTKTYFEEAEKLNVRAKGLLDGGTTPFSEKDLSYQLELLITTLKQDDNYKIEFSYDYKYYKENTGVGIPFAWHNHYYETHLKGSNILSNEIGTIYDIFSKNVRPKYSDDNALKSAYGNDLANYLINLEKQYEVKTITVSYLMPISVDNFEGNIPFAYKKTVKIDVSVNSGRIKTNDMVSLLREKNYITEDYEKNLLKCFNSNVLFGDYLDQTLDNNNHVTEYMVTYSSTYIIHLKSSSGGSDNFALKLTNMSDYYSGFCIGSKSSYSILDTDFYYAVYNNILNTYGLSGYKIPDGENKGSILTPSDLYGYWGFAIIPEGGGFDGLLSNFFDTRKNSNGLCIPFASNITLNSSGLLGLQYDFGYSWMSRRLGGIVNKLSSTESNATYYMFYVSELSNDLVYVISENGSLEQTDTSSLTSQAVEKTVKTAVKGFKKISSKFLSFFDNKVFLYIVFGVLGFAGVMIVLKLFLKKDK